MTAMLPHRRPLARLTAFVAVLAVAMIATVPARAAAQTITAVEGAPFNGQVGSYAAQCVGATLQNLQVTINWGDGTTAAGTAVQSGAELEVSGAHTYPEAGADAGSFSGSYECGQSPASFAGTFTAEVSDAPLSASGLSVSATAGTPFSATVATFTDADPDAIVSDFSASINWGDASSSAGTVSAAAGGGFTVSAVHTYASGPSASLPLTVTISDRGGASATATSEATVSASTPAPTPQPLPAPPAPIVPPSVAATFTTIAASPGGATLDASASAAAGASAARFDWRITGDRAGDVVCPGSEPVLRLSAGAPLNQTVTLTAIDARTGAATSALHLVRIPAATAATAGSVKSPLVSGLCSSSTSTPVPPLTTDRLVRGSTAVSLGGAPPAGCADDLVFGAVDVHGCLSQIPDPHDLPGGISFGLAQLLCQAHAGDFCLSSFTTLTNTTFAGSDPHARRAPRASSPVLGKEISTVETELARMAVPSYYSWSAVRLDGIDIVPQNGVPLLIMPAADAIVASQVKLYLDGRQLTPHTIPLALYAPSAGGNLGQITLPHEIPLIGSLPFTGSISVDLHRAHSALADGTVCEYACAALTVAVQLPGVFTDSNGKGTSASGIITADAVNGVQLDSLEVMLGSAEIAGIGVSDVDIRYRSSDESLHAQATFDLFDVAGQITGTVDLVHGDFQDASVQWDAGDGPGIDLGGPLNIYLTHLGGTVALNPTTIMANASLTGGPQTLGCSLLGIDGTATLQFSPFSFDADADGSLLCQHVAHEYLHYDDSGNFDFGGSVDIHFLFIEVMGGIDVAVDVPQGHFQFDGNVSACLDIFGRHCLGAEAVISDRGIGVCADLGFTHAGGGVQFPDHPVVFFDSCDIGKFRSLGFVTAVGESPRSFTVPKGERVAVIGLVGRGGAPVARLIGPDGRVIDTPADGYARTATQVVVRDDSDTRTTYFLIDHPAPGPWRVTPEPGSVPIETIEQAASLPQPDVRARVQPRRGGRERLTYSLRAIPGQRVTFAERAPDHGFRIIGYARGDGGRLTFTPSLQLARERTVLAMVSQYGHPRADLSVASFRAPPPRRLPAPGHLRARRTDAGLALRWSPVPGAERYLVSVHVSGSGTRHLLTGRPGVSVAGVPRLRSAHVEVVARRRSRWAARPGAAASVALGAERTPQARRVQPVRARR